MQKKRVWCGAKASVLRGCEGDANWGFVEGEGGQKSKQKGAVGEESQHCDMEGKGGGLKILIRGETVFCKVEEREGGNTKGTEVRKGGRFL